MSLFDKPMPAQPRAAAGKLCSDCGKKKPVDPAYVSIDAMGRCGDCLAAWAREVAMTQRALRRL